MARGIPTKVFSAEEVREKSTAGAACWTWLKEYIRKRAWSHWHVTEVGPEALQKKQVGRLLRNGRKGAVCRRKYHEGRSIKM